MKTPGLASNGTTPATKKELWKRGGGGDNYFDTGAGKPMFPHDELKNCLFTTQGNNLPDRFQHSRDIFTHWIGIKFGPKIQDWVVNGTDNAPVKPTPPKKPDPVVEIPAMEKEEYKWEYTAWRTDSKEYVKDQHEAYLCLKGQ